MDDLAPRDQRAVGIDVEQFAGGAVELDHAAFAKCEQVGERHRRRPDLDRDAQRYAGEQVEIRRHGDIFAVAAIAGRLRGVADDRSEEHTSELQSLMRISYAVFCLKQKQTTHESTSPIQSSNP